MEGNLLCLPAVMELTWTAFSGWLRANPASAQQLVGVVGGAGAGSQNLGDELCDFGQVL